MKIPDALIRAIQDAKRVLIVLHVTPDGDTAGASFALRRTLMALGKEVTVVCQDKLPDIYGNLDGAQALCHPEDVQESAELAIAVDVADEQRMGDCLAVYKRVACRAQIDHHATNTHYAQINWVESPVSATGVCIDALIQALGIVLDEATATCLFIAVSTDTGNFSQQNTDAAALEVAARCVRTGICVEEITRKLYKIRPLAQTMLLGKALAHLVLSSDRRIAGMYLSRADFSACGALREHTEIIVNYGIEIAGVQAAFLAIEQKEGIKISMRSLPPIDVAHVAARWGGGGHTQAAGCMLDMPLLQAMDTMQEQIQKEMGVY